MMRSSTRSEGPRLDRIAVLCAQIRVATEMHSRVNGAKHHAFREACSAGHVSPSLERSERRGLAVLCHSLVVDSTFEQGENVAIAVVSSSSCY